ncbi:Acyltransferase family [Geosmithia morbida]|uniref:Acyltransferase family n=1 Tax=Geosmithia morbida TaxID=1094350 RepID=A0A9P4YU06_9HYPO|nr:Acyltransferase family [Geosmithia morbida]KAF4122050.1 Acyltransferase family [Geosmithia morbida]
MLGHGAAPPGSLEPYESWGSLPIVCLLHRGRPMVAIFFAISGYVVCRHILRAIHERRIDAAYRSLASAALRRAFRLYIPPTVSMLLVAVLAQMGAFRSETDIYKGPDSVYINGTVSELKLAGARARCPRGIPAVRGAGGIADYLDLGSPDYLYNLTGWDGDSRICINTTSQLFGPASVYDGLVNPADGQIAKMSNLTRGLGTYALQSYVSAGVYAYQHDVPYAGPVPMRITGSNVTNCTEFKLVQLGGMWEEHPLIHDNATYAVQNFTRVYTEWVNPFNFGHYHTRYDPHTFTIPMEFRASLVLYIFLLATAAVRPRWRLGLACGVAAYSLHFGRWDVAAFMGAMAMSEYDIRAGARAGHYRLLQSESPSPHASSSSSSSWLGGRDQKQRRRRASAVRWALTILALHLLSYPDSSAEYTPGFRMLAAWMPRYYMPISGWMYYQSVGAVLLLRCILHEPVLCRFLESPVPQHLGRISFSFYLVHGPILHSLGFWVMPRLFDLFGQPVGFAIGWTVLLSLALYVSNIWYRHVDTWSMGVGRRVERFLLED